MKPKVWMDWNPAPELQARIREVAKLINDGDQAKMIGCEVVSGVRFKIDGALMDKIGLQLRMLARPGIGVDPIDVDAASARGILVCNTPDAPTESTAEYAIALLMAIAKRVIVGDMSLRNFDSGLNRNDMRGTELLGRTLGVVGYGRIGRRVAEIAAHGIKMKVLVHDPFVPASTPTPEGITLTDDLDEIFRESDFVTLHTPLMPSTRHLANEARLRSMKKGSYLINASRGPVVDEAALIAVLNDGHLAGAALDVTDPEPPLADNPLLKMTNVVVTPHIASNTDRGVDAMHNGAVDNIVLAAQGQRPRWIVNADVWPGRFAGL